MGFENLGHRFSNVSLRERNGIACVQDSCGCAACPLNLLCLGPNKHCDARHCDRNCLGCRAVCNRSESKDEVLRRLGGVLLSDICWSPFDLGPLPKVMFQLVTSLKRPVAAKGFIFNVKKLFYGDGKSGGSLKWSRQTDLRNRFNVPADVCTGISFCAKDQTVDYLGVDLEKTAEETAKFQVDFSFAVNLSIYENHPSFDAHINLRKRWLSIRALQEAGVRTIPDLGWLEYRQRRRVIDWLRENKVRYAVRNLQTITSDTGTGTWRLVVDDLVFLRRECPDLHLFLVGCTSENRMKSITGKLGSEVTFVDTRSHRMAEFRRDAAGVRHPVESIADVFDRSIALVEKWHGG